MTASNLQSSDIIDLRDLAELLADWDDVQEMDNDDFIALHRLFGQLCTVPDDHAGAWTEDEVAELYEAASDCANSIDPVLVNDDYFTEYAQDLAGDCGMIPTEVAWPLMHIDWEAAARDLQQDYTAIDLAGVTYWGRPE